MAHDEWDKAWETCKEGTDLKRYLDLPTKDNLQLHLGLKKSVCSVITQLRTKIALRDLLFKYGAMESPTCPCGAGRQTVQHILLSCRNYIDDRWETWGDKSLDIHSIATTKDLAVKAAKFMIRTGLLNVFTGTKVD